MSTPGAPGSRKAPSRQVLLVVDPETAEIEEIREALHTFGTDGSVVTLASEGARPPRAARSGAPVHVDLALEDVRPEDYDLPVVIGSAPATARLLTHPVVRELFENLQASQWDRRLKTALLRVSHAAVGAPTDDAFAEAVLEACGELLPDPVALLALTDTDRGALRLAATLNVPDHDAGRLRAVWEGHQPQEVRSALQERRVIHHRDVPRARDASATAGLMGALGVGPLVVAPLLASDDDPPFGVLLVGARAPLTRPDRDRVELVATECADALHRRRLKQRVEALAHDRGVALQRLRAAHAELEDFAYSVSHDLSEPLRGICTLTAYVRADLERKIPREDEEMLAKIEAAGGRLKEMVAGLLAVTRAMRLTPVTGSERPRVDTRQLVENCIVILTPSLQEKHARVEIVTEMPVVRAERAALEQIFLNLMTNALKHNDKATPLVRIGCEDAGHEWRFFVRDNGPGIAPEYQESVFRVYTRVPDNLAARGVGVGLALVRKLVDRQGGRVWVESEPGAGATFSFTFAKLPDETARASDGDAPEATRVDPASTVRDRAA